MSFEFEMNKPNNKIAIIGAGIIGTNCAYELQRLGYDVTLFDKTGIGEKCSKGNAGHFATEQVFPLATINVLKQLPKMLFSSTGPLTLSPKYFIKALPWFVRFLMNIKYSKYNANKNALKSLNKNAIKAYKQVLSDINAKYLMISNGSLLVFENTPLRDITHIASQYQNEGIALQVLNKSECKVLEPNLSESITFAIHFTDVAHTLDPQKVCQTIAAYVVEQGGTFVQEEVTDLTLAENCATVHINNRTYSFDKVLVATGAWAKELLGPLGYKVPIEAERGYHYQFSDSVHLSRPVVSAERQFIITPMQAGLRCAGTVEFSGLNAKPNYKRALLLKNQAKHILNKTPEPLSEHENLYQWCGDRPSFPDSLPVIGKAYKHDNLFLALGHQHLGLTLGAITGKLLGQVVTEVKTDIDLSPFCLSRFN